MGNTHLARLFHIRGIGQVPTHPRDSRILARVFRLGRDVERHDMRRAPVHQHLHQPAAHETHAAGHHAPLGHRGELLFRSARHDQKALLCCWRSRCVGNRAAERIVTETVGGTHAAATRRASRSAVPLDHAQ